MQKNTYEYRVYKGEDLIYSGTKKDIAKVLNCQENTILKSWRYNTKIFEYEIKRKLVKIEDVKKINIEEKKENNQKDKKIVYLKKHLLEYGNTILANMNRRKVESLLNKLEKEEGIKTKYEAKRYKYDNKNWYVVELIKNGKN